MRGSKKGNLGQSGAGHGNKISRRQEQALAALLIESTIEAAAAKAGVGYRTLKEWLRQTAFQEAYQAARREVLDCTVSQLVSASGKAVKTLVDCLECEKDGDAIRAADVILKHLGTLLEVNKADQVSGGQQGGGNDESGLFERIRLRAAELRNGSTRKQPGVPGGPVSGIDNEESVAPPATHGEAI